MASAWPECGSLEPADSPSVNNALFLLSGHVRDVAPRAHHGQASLIRGSPHSIPFLLPTSHGHEAHACPRAVPQMSLRGEFRVTHLLEITVQTQARPSNDLSQGRADC